MLKVVNPKYKGNVHIYFGENFDLEIKFNEVLCGKVCLILNTKKDIEIKMSYIYTVFHKIRKNQIYHKVLCNNEVFWINNFYLVDI
jgi:hypothetical protein